MPCLIAHSPLLKSSFCDLVFVIRFRRSLVLSKLVSPLLLVLTLMLLAEICEIYRVCMVLLLVCWHAALS